MQTTGTHPIQTTDKDAITSTPSGRGLDVLATVNRYESADLDWYGTLLEETSAFRGDIELFYDLHTLLWDPKTGETLDVRNDATGSDVWYESSRVPEVHLTNQFVFSDGGAAELRQDILPSVNTCGLFIRNEIDFERPADRTLFTVLGLGIRGHRHENPDAVNEAYVVRGPDCDHVVAHDRERYLAVAQQRLRDDHRRFDGARVGQKDVRNGPQRSAWEDVYRENDGAIEANDYGRGDLDVGFGLDASDTRHVEWLTAIGFCYGETPPVAHAMTLMDRGYERERREFIDAWEAWHTDIASGPTDDSTANDLYEKSLTSLKCAQDRCGAMIAGAFKPWNMTYRLIWPHDQVIITQALLAAGATAEARDALRWFDETQVKSHIRGPRGIDRKGTWWQNYYTTGDPHWQALQLDQVGGPIYAHWLTWRETGDNDVLDEQYEMSRLAAEFLLGFDEGGFPRKHQDPWEETWGYTTEGSAAAIAGLRCMAEMADATEEAGFADECRTRAQSWASNFEIYCFEHGTPYGDHFVTAGQPESAITPAPDARPDAAAFMAFWPWNVVGSDDETLRATIRATDHPDWTAHRAACLGRYPGDRYTPSHGPEEGGWPLCEGYADVARWATDVDTDAVATYLFEDAPAWTTAAGLLPERVTGEGRVCWNANLQWSQAIYVLLAEAHVRGAPFGFAPSG